MPKILSHRILGISIFLICSNIRVLDEILIAQSKPRNNFPVFLDFELLPEKFTMRQLQKLYEAILNEKLDKRNFINKINSLDVLLKLKDKDMSSSKKGSFLYSFDEEKYKKKLDDGFSFKV